MHTIYIDVARKFPRGRQHFFRGWQRSPLPTFALAHLFRRVLAQQGAHSGGSFFRVLCPARGRGALPQPRLSGVRFSDAHPLQ